MTRPVMLVVLDGFGIGDRGATDSTAVAHTPFLDSAAERHPLSQVETSGEAVGLPPGQMGNSEVGHMTMGAGRIIEQDMVRVGRALARGEAADVVILDGGAADELGRRGLARADSKILLARSLERKKNIFPSPEDGSQELKETSTTFQNLRSSFEPTKKLVDIPVTA